MTAGWVASITAVAVALAALAGWAARWAWRILSRTTQFLDDYFGEPAREGIEARPGVMARLRNVESLAGDIRAETRPDGGNSMRDIVHRVADELGALRSRMELFETQREGRDNGDSVQSLQETVDRIEAELTERREDARQAIADLRADLAALAARVEQFETERAEREDPPPPKARGRART
jgi:hypothetical protein